MEDLLEDGIAPSWLDLPCDQEDVSACDLAVVDFATRVGNTDSFVVTAVPYKDGGLRVLVFDDYETKIVVPHAVAEQPLSLGELLRILDESHPEGDPDFARVGHPLRERNLTDAGDAPGLASAVTISSKIYLQLAALDAARKAAWVEAVVKGTG